MDKWRVVLAAANVVLDEIVFLESPPNLPSPGYALPIHHIMCYQQQVELCVGVTGERRCRAGGAAHARWSSHPVPRHAVVAEALHPHFKYVTPG
ncbi:MAG TPA: hypothetical protein DEF43_14430 [Chloroflexus aurantiacus]|uniref:Uncharacterized protein n=1 Tax=Chloroflexus aurantiacus (strain ATCC 29366 / DSM 635 / J-10-fl) TaxID=324602 RepID=A9WHW5_CHLAA|nr:hypothetical protein Caur_1001 [Chloroflexus aurantiacus J-10-fl]RMG50717.1 MAG: hypothetical protein D6716_07800 [Chloroflexota bacterium]HBW68323.1 hypothetical protein [Chloroflexus aurantiacus]